MDRSDVFLSYRRANVEFAKQLDQALKATGREVWVDWEDIPPGIAGFTDEIERGIEGADAMLCVLSPEYMQSEYCLMELRHALALNKRIVPVVYNKFEGDAPEGIGHINWVYFCPHAGQTNPFDEAFAKVVAALETDFEHVRTHTRLMLRAKEWDVKKRSEGFLLNEGEVDEAQHWLGKASTLHPAPHALHLEYIVSSHKRQTQRQRRARAQLTAGLGVSLVLLVAAVIMTIFAEQNRIEAEESRQVAELKEAQAQSLALAANAKNMLNEGDSTLALALARTAAEQVADPSPEVQRTLSSLVYAPGMRYRLNDNQGAVIAVAFHPTQPMFLTADATGRMFLYNRASGTIAHAYEVGQRITAVAFNPTGDVIAVALADNTVRLLDAASGEVQSELTGHTGAIQAITFNPSGQYLASGSEDWTVRLWDVTTGKVERTFKHPGVVLRTIFSPDGTRLATSTADASIANDTTDKVDRKARVWDVETGEMLLAITPGSGFVRSLDYSPDGRTLALGALDSSTRGTLRFYDVSTGEEIRRIFAHLDVVTNLVFSPDGAYVASTSWDGNLLVWDVQRQLLIQQFIGFEDRLLSLDYSPDGEYLLVGTGNVGNNEFVEGSVDTSVWLIDLKNRDEVLTFQGHNDWVWAVDISADGVLAATGSGPFESAAATDTSVRVWTIETGEETQRLEGHSDTVDAVAFHPDGKRLLSGGWDRRIILWNIETGEIVREYEGHTDGVYHLAFNKAGTQFASASADGTVRLWNTETGELLREFESLDGAVSPISSVDFSPDETQLVTASDDKQIRLWDVKTGALLKTLSGHTDIVNQVIFSPNGQWLASSSWDDTVRLWDASTGILIRHFVGHNGNTFGLAFSADSALLLSASQDRTLRLWDVASGTELHRFEGHTDWVTDLVLSPDESIIISVSEDKTARVWRLDEDIPSLLAFADENRYVRDLNCDERIAYGADACEVDAAQ